MLATNDQIFCQMGNYSPDGYFIYDVEVSSMIYINEALCTIFNLHEETLRKYPAQALDRVHAEDRDHVETCFAELLEDRTSKKYVFRLAFSGVEKHLKAALSLSVDGRFIYGIIDDITVAQQNKIHTEQINARKNVTLEVLSHDLKEPLGMIRMAATSLKGKIGVMDEEELRSALGFISEMCERNLKLVRSMVNHEFLKSSVVAIKKERADLIWELKDVVRFYTRSHLSEIRNFSFSSAQEKIFLFLDSMKFLQVINNLISNSIKFTGLGGTIKVYAEDRGDQVMISVADDGIGIPQDIRNNLFQRSKEVLRKGLNGEESGGLGMGIIKDIVDLHSGKIWVVSEQGLGTTFYIELPKV